MHAVLYPFLEHTPQATANNVLLRYVQYHTQLGYSRFYQYTQVRTAAKTEKVTIESRDCSAASICCWDKLCGQILL